MVVFMVKWAIASIPAFIILAIIGFFAWGFILALSLVDCLGLLFGEELPTLTESASTLHVIGTEGVIQGVGVSWM